jgi:hypothetical protein
MAMNVSHILTYVESEWNRADKTSRGEVGPPTLCLPPIELLKELHAYISDYV